ncbi:MAG: hypothetical protein U0936_13620 [Planctomycetaceae bacterium]
MSNKNSLSRWLVLVWALSISQVAVGQQGGLPSKNLTESDRTEPESPVVRNVELDVLIHAAPSYRVKAQEWGRLFQELGYTPKFRSPKPGEEIRVEDVVDGDYVSVKIVCGMSQDGSIRIGQQKFTLDDSAKLRSYLDELRNYGSGGPPERNPTWGMSEEQLMEIMKLLSEPVTGVVQLQSPLVAVESLGLPEGVKLTFADSARERAFGRRPASAPEELDLKGCSKGSGIAILLSQYGLGFRPLRIAANRFELQIDAGGESNNLWPTGWKTQETVSRVLPAYLKSIPVDVQDAEISALLNVVSERLKVPVFQSSFELASAGKNLDELTYSRSEKKIAPSRLLTSIGDKHQLGFDVRVDEGGKMFLWATTAAESNAFRVRFAHVKQLAE